ncbi:MAG: Uma2 family endonuclease [Arcicella sp.]|nr:Uma2 family endonuclease [Arcicella sp.]
MVAIAHKRVVSKKIALSELVYEQMDGKDIYYRGYKDVLNGKKTLEEIMSCSDLQGVLVSLLNGVLFSKIDRKQCLLCGNEFGLHLSKNDNLGIDLAIFDKKNIDKLEGKFFTKAPKVVIEVDIKASIEITDYPAKEMDYIFDKSQKLLDFGVEKVFWITTKTRKIFMATQHQNWLIMDWNSDIEVMDGIAINVKQILDDEEINY